MLLLVIASIQRESGWLVESPLTKFGKDNWIHERSCLLSSLLSFPLFLFLRRAYASLTTHYRAVLYEESHLRAFIVLVFTAAAMFSTQKLLKFLALLAASVQSFSPPLHSAVHQSSVSSNKHTALHSSSSNGENSAEVDASCNRRQLFSRIGVGCAYIIASSRVANAEVAGNLSVSSQAKVSLDVKTQPTPAPAKAPALTAEKTVPKGSNKLANPGDVKNCSDFESYKEAKAWFDKYYDLYGDVARLDGNNNLIPCEALPGAPKTK